MMRTSATAKAADAATPTARRTPERRTRTGTGDGGQPVLAIARQRSETGAHRGAGNSAKPAADSSESARSKHPFQDTDMTGRPTCAATERRIAQARRESA